MINVLVSALMLAALMLRPAMAQEYPNKPIRLVVGFATGGSNDLIARILAPKLAEILKVQVIVDNKPGANAMIGTEHVAKSSPDGYTLTLGSISPFVLSPQIYPTTNYDTLKDLIGITTVGMTPQVIAVNNASPYRTLPEFIAYAKRNPGGVDLGTSGIGSNTHLVIELLKAQARIDIRNIPYKGTGPALTDAMGGHLAGVVADLPGVLGPVKSDKLRALAVTSEDRNSLLPDVPTAREQGVSGLVAVNWFAVMAPSRTPEAVISKLHKALVTAANSSEVKSQFQTLGIQPFVSENSEAFNKFFHAEYARWGEVIKHSKISVN